MLKTIRAAATGTQADPDQRHGWYLPPAMWLSTCPTAGLPVASLLSIPPI